MIVRFGSVTVAPARRATLAVAAALVVASGGIQSAIAADAPAAAADAASGASAASVASVASVGQYTVRAGQSLNDVAADLTQTHDKATLARVSRALFDANPDAFMKHGALAHDPSRMKIGAVLIVPAMPDIVAGASGASGVVAASSASSSAAAGASAAGAATSSEDEAASASVAAGSSAPASAAAEASATVAGASEPAASVAASSPAAAAVNASAASAGAAASTVSASAAAASAAPGASSGASAAPTSDAHVWSGAIQAASGTAASDGHPQAPVSSIQELLALKNRVLMALQKHGIGKSGEAGGNAQPAAPTSGNSGAPTPAAGATPSTANVEWTPSTVGIAAAVVAVVLLLLIRLTMRRRKPEPQPTPAETGAPSPVDGDDGATRRAADAGDDAPLHDEPQPRNVEPGEPETLADATGAAGLEAAAALGADALPPESIETARVHAQEAERAQRADDEQHESPAAVEPQPPVEPAVPQEAAQPAAADAFALQAAEPAPPDPEPADGAPPPAAPTEFPADAVAALDTLDMPLPPRVGEPTSPASPASPTAPADTTEPQPEPPDEPAAPPARDAIEAGPAGAASIAGLGAARFGALSLDFDLNLPPDSAEPLPVFTPEQLARIARNKLDLAHEYIALGDLVGARTLINEVIESNDLATRADAQALLATLAPLS